jgi:hypothetical protein
MSSRLAAVVSWVRESYGELACLTRGKAYGRSHASWHCLGYRPALEVWPFIPE